MKTNKVQIKKNMLSFVTKRFRDIINTFAIIRHICDTAVRFESVTYV